MVLTWAMKKGEIPKKRAKDRIAGADEIQVPPSIIRAEGKNKLTKRIISLLRNGALRGRGGGQHYEVLMSQVNIDCLYVQLKGAGGGCARPLHKTCHHRGTVIELGMREAHVEGHRDLDGNGGKKGKGSGRGRGKSRRIGTLIKKRIHNNKQQKTNHQGATFKYREGPNNAMRLMMCAGSGQIEMQSHKSG